MKDGAPRVLRGRLNAPLFKLAVQSTILVLLLIMLCSCQSIVLDPQGIVGSAEKTILLDSLAIMLAIVVPTIVATLVFAWWFRATNPRTRYLPEWAYSGRIELITWSIPLLTIMLLGGVRCSRSSIATE